MNSNLKFAVFVPCLIAITILCCMTWELLALVPGICPSCFYDENIARWLYLGSVVWSFLYVLKTVWQLDIKIADKLFWIGIAAIPVMFFVFLTFF